MRIIATTTILALLAAKSEAACYFSLDLGDGNLDRQGERTGFDVVTDGTTTCEIETDSGTDCSLTIAYGSFDPLFNPGKTVSSANCGTFQVSLTADDREYQLAWDIQATAANNLRMTCTCDATVQDTLGTGWCFSGESLVQVEGKGELSMDSLQVGDRVLAGNNKYEPVYAFGHIDEDSVATFFQIYTNFEHNRKPLEVTGNHLVFKLNDKGQHEAVRADKLYLRDKLIAADGEIKTVTMVKTVEKQGMYMPLTPDGTIIVNGLKASAYTSISAEAPQVVSDVATMFFSEQALTHWWLSPFRMMCMGVSSQFCGNSANQRGEHGILKWLMTGHNYATVAEQYGSFFRLACMGTPTVFLFAFFNAMEHVFWGPSIAPLAASLFAAALYYRNRMMANINNAPVKSKTV